MKDLSELAIYHRNHPTLGPGDQEGGFFLVPFPPLKGPKKYKRGRAKIWIAVIASIGMGWDHVSVSLPHRCPTWVEMDYIKRLFFNQEEVVIQIHPSESNHINVHNFCLHLWRPHNQVIPTPPLEMI